MEKMHEPEAMAEIRGIREQLSQELKDLTPLERMELIKSGAAKLEKDSGLKLRRIKTEKADAQ